MSTRRIIGCLAATIVVTFTVSSAAVAAPVDIDDGAAEVPAGNILWEVANWGDDYGFSITEATVYADDVDAADPGTATEVNSDALDGQFTIMVDDAYYGSAACDSETEICDYTVDISPAGDDTVVTAPSEVMSGLDVAVQQRFYGAGDLARTVVSLHNPSAAAITVPVQAITNYGSDSDTTLEADSTADDAVTAADHWFVTGDGGGWDPVVTTAWSGPSAVLPPADATLGSIRYDSADESAVIFDVTVAPGQTAYLAFFVSVRGWLDVPPVDDDLHAVVPVAEDYAAAIDASEAAASEFGAFGGRLTAGLPAGTPVLNWGTVGGAAPATPVVVAPAFTG